MLNILLVEDNAHDVLFITNALAQSNLNSSLFVVSDGAECLNYVNGFSPFKGMQKPDLIILDINMPNMDGHEVLQKLKHNPKLKLIPVVVLSSSKDKKDILSAYDNYANSYVVKPTDALCYIKVVQEIENFWASISEIP